MKPSGSAQMKGKGGPTELKARGRLKDINVAQSWFSLEDGTRFQLGKGVSLAERKAGEEVTVSYEARGEKKIATRVSKAGV